MRLIWKAADTLGWPFGPIVRLLLLTGARRGEVVGMRWDEVDLEKKLWSLPAARVKNKRAHALPLSSAAIDILKSLPRIENDDGIVFPARIDRRTSRGEKRASSIGIFDAPSFVLITRLRSLQSADGSVPLAQWGSSRSSPFNCASGMARLGVDLHVIERCLNHVSGSFGGIVGVYQKHKFEDGMRRAMDAWAAMSNGLRAAVRLRTSSSWPRRGFER